MRLKKQDRKMGGVGNLNVEYSSLQSPARAGVQDRSEKTPTRNTAARELGLGDSFSSADAVIQGM